MCAHKVSMYYTLGVYLIIIVLVLQCPINCLFRSLPDKNMRQKTTQIWTQAQQTEQGKAVGKNIRMFDH